jgi:hypothetical protein
LTVEIVIEKEGEIERGIDFLLVVLTVARRHHLWEPQITIHMSTEIGIGIGSVGWEFLVTKDTPVKGLLPLKLD